MYSGKPSLRPRHGGFTFIEMLFALALLLLVTSFTTSAVARWLESRKLLDTANALVVELEGFRVSAIEDSLDIAFHFEGGSNEYTVEVTGDVPLKRLGRFQSDGVVFETSLLNGDISKTITFRRDGTADESQILLSDKAGKYITIRIHRLTGPEVVQ